MVKITDDLQVKYGMGIFDSLATLTLRYRLMPRLYLQAVSGMNQAVDLLYQFEFNLYAGIVYGSLRRNQGNHHWMTYAQLLSDTKLAGYKLYDLGFILLWLKVMVK